MNDSPVQNVYTFAIIFIIDCAYIFIHQKKVDSKFPVSELVMCVTSKNIINYFKNNYFRLFCKALAILLLISCTHFNINISINLCMIFFLNSW